MDALQVKREREKRLVSTIKKLDSEKVGLQKMQIAEANELQKAAEQGFRMNPSEEYTTRQRRISDITALVGMHLALNRDILPNVKAELERSLGK
jgi:hypothetical protein